MTEKFKRLVHYICWRVSDASKLGAIKLNKILWYSDTFAYRLYGEPITGAIYIKQKNGPVPKHVLIALRQLEAEGKVVVRETEFFGYKKKEFIALQPPDPAAFAEREVKIIDDVIVSICDHHTGTSISDLSHDQIWDAASIGEELPMFSTLAATEGEYTDDILVWADSVLNSQKESGQRVG